MEKPKQYVASCGSILIAGPGCTTITKFFSERGCDCYTVLEISAVPVCYCEQRMPAVPTGSEDAGVSTRGLKISNVLACRKH